MALILAVASVAAAAHTVPDTMAQRALACTGCHGAQGRASASGYVPRLAGKPADYLFQQLRHFRDGRRSNPEMAHLLQPLTDEFLRELAGHFAAQQVAYPAPEPATLPPATLALGRALVSGEARRPGVPGCAQCHGRALTGAEPAVPGLLGLPRGYLAAQLGAWKSGVRRAAAPDCMAEIAKKLSPEDIAAVSQWLAAQPLPADTHPAAAGSLPQPLPLACGSLPR